MPRVKIAPSCQICLTKDETQFYPRIKNKCRTCVLVERKEQYNPVKKDSAPKSYKPREQNITKKVQTKPQPKPYRTVPLRKVNMVFDAKIAQIFDEIYKNIGTVDIDRKTREIKKFHDSVKQNTDICSNILNIIAQETASFYR